jgi:hypothetical protein
MTKARCYKFCSFGLCEEKPGSGFGFGLQHLATTVEAGRADVVTQMGFTGRRFNRNARHSQGIVRTVHTAFGRGLFILLDGHDPLLGKSAAQSATQGVSKQCGNF